MNNKKQDLALNNTLHIDEGNLFSSVSEIIEKRKFRAQASVNSEITLMYWEVGQFINSVLLNYKRAEYGKKILPTLSAKLMEAYGNSFTERNLYRMMLFAERFAEIEILPTLSAKLSWSHFLEILPLKSAEAQLYYANFAAEKCLSVKELRRQISRKAYERREIAGVELPEQFTTPFNVFRDPYLLDMFGLKDNFDEADLEKAVLTDIQAFILEFGHGFAFVDKQKRMIIDGEDVILDLLFYNRILKRLVVVDFKIGKFKAAYKGQMELYLGWLDKYERQPGEEAPIGIILCASANKEKIELLKMDNSGVAVAEYWTQLPPKAIFESRIKEILEEAQERLVRRKSFPTNGGKHIDYYLDKNDDDF
jgi:predicted nuclease of restriction endonuclease-like (RecB) superfamily